MRRGGLDVPNMGEGGGPSVEMDETYIGRISRCEASTGRQDHKYSGSDFIRPPKDGKVKKRKHFLTYRHFCYVRKISRHESLALTFPRRARLP